MLHAGIDESFHNAALRGTGTRGEEKPVRSILLISWAIARTLTTRTRRTNWSRFPGARMPAGGHPPGQLSRSTFHAARLHGRRCNEGDTRRNGRASWTPKSGRVCRRRSTRPKCQSVKMHNQQVKRLARFWRLLEWTMNAQDERSPWLEVRHTLNDKNQVEI